MWLNATPREPLPDRCSRQGGTGIDGLRNADVRGHRRLSPASWLLVGSPNVPARGFIPPAGTCSPSALARRRRPTAHVRGPSACGRRAAWPRSAVGPSRGRLPALDEVLEEQERGLPGLHRKVLLHLFAFFPSERRIGQDDVEAVRLLDVGEVLAQGVGQEDVRRVDPVQDQVHDPDDVRQRLLFLAVEGGLLQARELCGRECRRAVTQIVVGLAQKTGGPTGRVPNRLAQSRSRDLHHGANEGRGV